LLVGYSKDTNPTLAAAFAGLGWPWAVGPFSADLDLNVLNNSYNRSCL
jgi:hypothetical protein